MSWGAGQPVVRPRWARMGDLPTFVGTDGAPPLFPHSTRVWGPQCLGGSM